VAEDGTLVDGVVVVGVVVLGSAEATSGAALLSPAGAGGPPCASDVALLSGERFVVVTIAQAAAAPRLPTVATTNHRAVLPGCRSTGRERVVVGGG
jgi:hypothetical protein